MVNTILHASPSCYTMTYQGQQGLWENVLSNGEGLVILDRSNIPTITCFVVLTIRDF